MKHTSKHSKMEYEKFLEELIFIIIFFCNTISNS